MKLFESFDIKPDKPAVVSFVGGGGKTSALFRLARELADRYNRVLVGTTTKIFSPPRNQYNRLIYMPSVKALEENVNPSEGITLLAESYDEASDKLIGVSPSVINRIADLKLFRYILVEADGSKGRPIKAPGEHEPVIPINTGILVGVTGFDCYMEEISDRVVHRPSIFSSVTGQKEGSVIEARTLYRLIMSPHGMFKGAPKDCKRIWLLNKVDNDDHLSQALDLCRSVQKNTDLDRILICSLKQKDPVKWVLKEK